MALIVQCGSCGSSLKVPEDMAGRKVRCSACKNVLVVPAADPGAAEPGPPAPPETPAPAPSSPPARGPARKASAAPPPRVRPPVPAPEPGPAAEKDEEKEEEGAAEGATGEPAADAPAGDRAKRREGRREGRGASGRPRGAGADAGEARGAGPARKSRAGLVALLAVGGAFAAALVVAGILALSGSGTEGEGAGGDGDGGPGEASAPPKKDAAGGAKTGDRELEAYRDLVGNAADAAGWIAAGEKARALGRAEAARRHFLRAAALDPQAEKAWEALGYRKYAVPAPYRHLLEAKDFADSLKR
ncbi:MAG: zinc-ribbon domain-containing protein, partial [Planctomycetes bacterium]|nr:zinc-ribbon domain-containing protein [Planctomycetota bacterium]